MAIVHNNSGQFVRSLYFFFLFDLTGQLESKNFSTQNLSHILTVEIMKFPCSNYLNAFSFCHNAVISSKWPFQYTKMVNKIVFHQIAESLVLGFKSIPLDP